MVPADSRPPAVSGILVRVSGTNQHYLPASLIGGFGQPAASGKLREARIAVRRKATGAVDAGFPKAETLAWRPGMYRLTAPPPGVDPDAVDKLWDPVENSLRDLVARLAARRLQPGDDALLFDYAATAGVRHPSFEDVAADYQARQGLPAPQGDGVQYARVLALGNQRPVMPSWRWRVLHSPADAPRLMITDRGWDVRGAGKLADARAVPPVPLQNCRMVFDLGLHEISSRSPVVLVDYAAEDFAPLDRQVQRNVGLVVVVGRSLLAGLVRAVAVVMGDVVVQDR